MIKNKTKNIALTGIGIALFVVLSLCLQVPVFENYYLCLGYIVMAVYLYSVGIVSGTIVGFAGTILYCIIINGLRGMPGWSLGNIIIGILLGLAFKISKQQKNKLIEIIICVFAIIISTGLGILCIKSGMECILYAQPFFVRIASNIYAFVADVFVLIISLPICKKLDKLIKKI